MTAAVLDLPTGFRYFWGFGLDFRTLLILNYLEKLSNSNM